MAPTSGGGSDEWSIWQIAISLMSGGALTSFLGLAFWGGGKASQIAELRERLDNQEKALQANIDKGDERHEANIEAIHRVTTAVASVPTKQDFQRLEDQIARRMGETDQRLQSSLSEFKQILFRASRGGPDSA